MNPLLHADLQTLEAAKSLAERISRDPKASQSTRMAAHQASTAALRLKLMLNPIHAAMSREAQ